MAKRRQLVTGRIDHAWLGWFPQAGWNMEFWLSVANAVRKRGIRRGDRNGVVRICREIWNIQHANEVSNHE